MLYFVASRHLRFNRVQKLLVGNSVEPLESAIRTVNSGRLGFPTPLRMFQVPGSVEDSSVTDDALLVNSQSAPPVKGQSIGLTLSCLEQLPTDGP